MDVRRVISVRWIIRLMGSDIRRMGFLRWTVLGGERKKKKENTGRQPSVVTIVSGNFPVSMVCIAAGYPLLFGWDIFV